MAETGTQFVVKRLNWAENYDGELVRQPGEARVVSFATFEEADTERAKREEEYRKRVNPFECGKAIHYWTHLDEPRLRDWLMDHGIEPPEQNKDGTTSWAAWWKKNKKTLGKEKCAVVWEILDKVRFFAVREEPIRAIGYAVTAINWQYNDEYYDADGEGGDVVTVYRSRERAEAECADLNDQTREIWEGEIGDMGFDEDLEEDEFEADDEYGMFDMQEHIRRRRGLLPGEKLKKGEGIFKSLVGVPFYEVIEVELEGLQ